MTTFDFLKGFVGTLTGEKDDEVEKEKKQKEQKETPAPFSWTEKSDWYATPVPENMKKPSETFLDKKKKYAEENAGIFDTWELWFNALKKEASSLLESMWKDLWSPSDVIKTMWSPLKALSTAIAPVKFWLTAAWSVLDYVWNNVVDRTPYIWGSYDKKVKESIDRIYEEWHSKSAVTQKQNSSDIATIDSMKKNIDIEEGALSNLDASVKMEEEALKKSTVFDTDYYNKKKAIENDKIAIAERYKILQWEKNKYIEASKNQQKYEMENRWLIAWFTFTDSQTEKYNKNIVDQVYIKDGQRFWNTIEESQTKEFISRLEQSIMKSANSAVSVMDEENVYIKSSIVDNDEVTNMIWGTLKSARDLIMENFESISDEKILDTWEKVRVLNNEKAWELLRTKLNSNFSSLDDKLVNVRRQSYADMRDYYDPYSSRVYKDRWVVEGLYLNLVPAAKDAFMENVSDRIKTNFDLLRDKDQWIREAALENTMLWDSARYVAINWFQLWFDIASLVASFWATSLTKSSKAAAFMKEANVLLKELSVMKKELKAGEEFTEEMIAISNKISELNKAAAAAEKTSLAGKVKSFWLDSTRSLPLNKAINYIARKAAGWLDQCVVSIPSDIAFSSRTDTESDIKLNAQLNMLPWFWAVKSLSEIDKISKWISGLPEAERLSKFEKATWLGDFDINISWNDPETISKNRVKSVNFWLKALIWTDKGKAATAAMQTIIRDIDAMDYEKVKILWWIAGAIEADKTIWVSLSKNTSKDIKSIIDKAEEAIKLTDNEVTKTEIINKATQEVKNRFKRFAWSFDVNTLNDIYKRNFAKEQLENWIDLMAAQIAEWIGASDPMEIRLAIVEYILKWDVTDMNKTKFQQMIAGKVAEWSIRVDEALMTAGDKASLYKNTMSKTQSVINEASESTLLFGKQVQENAVIAWENMLEAAWEVIKKRKSSLTKTKKAAAVAEDVAEWVDTAKKTKSTKAVTTETKAVDNVPVQETSIVSEQSKRIYDNAEKIVKSFIKDNWDVLDKANDAATRKVISDYIKTKFWIDMTKDAPSTLDVAVDISKRTTDKAVWDSKTYVNAIGATKKWASQTKLAEKLWKEADIVSWWFDSVDWYDESIEIVNTMLSRFQRSSWTEKSSMANSIVEWIAWFVDMMKRNWAIIKVSKLDEGIHAMVKVVKWDTAQKIVVGMGTHIINSMEAFSKIVNPSNAQKLAFAQDIWIMLHELWHVVSSNIDGKIRKFVIGSLKKEIITSEWLMNNKVVQEIVWKGTFNSRQDYYSNLAKNKEYDTLAEEIFADRFSKDMLEAISDPIEYSQKMARIISWEKSTNLRRVYEIIKNSLEKVSDFVNSIITTWNYAWARKNISDVMSFINYAAIKWDVNYHWNVKWKWEEIFYFKNPNKVEFTKNIPWLENVDNHTKTLLDSWIARDEAINIVAWIKWKKDVVISETMLTARWISLLDNILQWVYWATKWDLAKYRKIINDSKVANQKALIWKYYYMRSQIYQWGKLIVGNGLVKLLSSLPKRISSGVWRITSHVGWVFMDPKLEIIKYMINSDFDSWMKYMSDFYNDFFGKFNTTQLVWDYAPLFAKKILWEEDAAKTWDAISTLYKRLRTKISEKLVEQWYSERLADDILNPLLYNPFEYIMGTVDSVYKDSDRIDDIIMAVLLRRHWKNLNLMPVKEEAALYEMFDRMPKWANLRNRQISLLSKSFWEFMDARGGEIIMNESNFAEYINKIMWYSLYWDNIGKNQTILDNSISLLLNDYRAAWATEEQLSELERILNSLPYDSQYWKLKSSEELAADIAEAEKSISELWLPWSVKAWETMKAIKDSIEQMATEKDSTILAEYLMHRFNESENMKVLANDAEKTLVDIEDEIEATAQMNKKIEEQANSIDSVALSEAIINRRKNKKTWVGKVTKEDVKIVAWQFWITEDEAKTAVAWWFNLSNLISDPKGIDEWTLAAMVFSNILEWDVWYLHMLNSSESFRDMVRASYDSSYKNMMEKWVDGEIETYTIDSAGNYISKYDDMVNWKLSRWIKNALSSGVTIGKLMSDEEWQSIIWRLVNNRKKSYIYTNLDLSSVFPNSKGKKVMNIQMFTAWARQRFVELTKWLSDSDVNSIVQNVIFSESWKAQWKMWPKAKAFHDFFSEYYASISKYRQRYWFWDFRTWFMSSVTDKNTKSSLSNRISSLSNYLSNSDIARLWEKYGTNIKDWEAMLTTFVQDIIYWAGKDRNKLTATLDKINTAAMNVEMIKMYWPQAWYKMFQQMISNESQARWILAAWSVDDMYIDQFMAMIDWKDIWFSLGSKDLKEWLLWEKQSGWKWSKILDMLWSMNSLLWWDNLTKKRALRSSFSIALSNIMDTEWEEWLRFLARDINRFSEFKNKYKLSDDDFINQVSLFKKMESLAKTSTKNMDVSKRVWEINKILDETASNASFFRNYYEPFIGKVRNSMGIFYVMDNIPELWSIRLINKYRYWFWLMKRAVGKASEYAYDVHKALRSHPFTVKWINDALNEPIFRRIFTDIAISAKIWSIMDKVTWDQSWSMNTFASVCVPAAAFSMLIGSDIMKATRKWVGVYEQWDWWIEAVLNGTLQLVKEVSDRAFIWMWMIGTDFAKIQATAAAWNTEWDKLSMWFKEFLKIAFVNQFDKYYKINTQWVKTDAIEVLNRETIAYEYLFWVPSSTREKLNNISSAIYESRAENNEKSNTDSWRDYLPIPSNFSQMGRTQPDVWILLWATNEYIEEKWLDYFIKNWAPVWKIMSLIDESDINKALNWDMKNVPAIDRVNITPDNVMEMWIKYWFITEDVWAFKTITSWLKWTSAEWKDLMSMRYSSIPEENVKEFEATAKQFFDEKYNVKKKWYTLTQKDLTEFVNMASKFWWAAAMWTYMSVYANEYKKVLAKSLWLKTWEISAAKTWDAIGISEWSQKSNEYMQYVMMSRELQKQIIKDNWSWIQWEKHIWIELMNDYIANDKKGIPLWKYGTSMSDLKSNVAKWLYIEQLDKIRKEEWYKWLIYPLSMLQLKSIDSYANIDIDNVWADWLARAWKSLIKTNNDILNIVNSKNDPILSQMVKVGLASSMYKYMTKLDQLDPNISKQIKDLIWEENIQSAVNSLTDSPPSSVMTAFEQVFDTNLHPGWGKWKKLPDAKVIKNAAKSFLADYNKLSKWASGYPWLWSSDLPRKYTYAPNSEWTGIVPVRIDIKPTDWGTGTQQIRWQWTSSSKLEVAKLPIKEWRVLGWTYRAWAIKGAKVYARKIGWKRV